MKIEVRKTKAEGVVQITTLDERWYIVGEDMDNPYPSITWIAGYYPKGIAFYKWLADKGWDEAEALKQAAGDRGSKVHHAIECLLLGQEVKINDGFPDSQNLVSELTVEEWETLLSFADWFRETKPEVLQLEQVVIDPARHCAGTLDLKCKIGQDVWIIDFKTSQNVWPEHELQISAYSHCAGNEDVTRRGILQLGYRRNKKLWKLTEVEDKIALFDAARLIWHAENDGIRPKQKDYPTTIRLEVNHAAHE